MCACATRFRHHHIHNYAKQLVIYKNHESGIESFWSFAKVRGLAPAHTWKGLDFLGAMKDEMI
jgi:hypothetical protein